MAYYIIKLILSALVVVVVSEVAKRSTLLGALVASLPLTSILAIVWLYMDTKNLEKVGALSYGILLIFIPSLLFFIALPAFLKLGWGFWPSLTSSIFVTGGAYLGYSIVLSKLNVNI